MKADGGEAQQQETHVSLRCAAGSELSPPLGPGARHHILGQPKGALCWYENKQVRRGVGDSHR